MAITSLPKTYQVRNVIDAGTAGTTKTYRVSIGPLKTLRTSADVEACFSISELLAVNLEHPTIRVERTVVDILEQV